MRPWQIDYDIVELKTRDFRNPQATAAGQADNDSITSVVRRAAATAHQVGKNGR
jgi:hypothetical protein